MVGDVDTFQKSLKHSTASISSLPNEIIHEVQASFDNHFDLTLFSFESDYDPPRYQNSKGQSISLADEEEKQRQRGENVSSSVRKTFRDISNFSLRNKATVSNISDSLPGNFDNLIDTTFSVSAPILSFAPFSAPKIETLTIFDHLDTILGVLYFIDTVYRLWLSLRVIRRHWGLGLVETPPCDIRVSAEAEPFNNWESGVNLQTSPREHKNRDVETGIGAETDPRETENVSLPIREGSISPPPKNRGGQEHRKNDTTKRSVGGPVTLTEAIIKLCTSFPAHVLLVSLAVIFVFYTMFSIYIPSYHSYIENCVQHADGAEGTFVGRNIRALGLNYASSAGNEKQARRIGDYNELVSDYCAKEQGKTKEAYIEQVHIQRALSRDMRSYISTHDAYIGCINISAADSLFNNACSSGWSGTDSEAHLAAGLKCPINDLTGKPYDFVGSKLPSMACEIDNNWELDHSAIFNCRYCSVMPFERLITIFLVLALFLYV